MLENLPTVTFGKYKGQPITTLMSDTKYVEWLSQQEGIRTRYRVLYKHCIIDGGIPLNSIYIEHLAMMTAQKELTAKYLETCFNKSYDKEYWQKFNNRRDKHICFKYERSQYIGIYCLFVKEFNLCHDEGTIKTNISNVKYSCNF